MAWKADEIALDVTKAHLASRPLEDNNSRSLPGTPKVCFDRELIRATCMTGHRRRRTSPRICAGRRVAPPERLLEVSSITALTKSRDKHGVLENGEEYPTGLVAVALAP
jgi:hypothetical protein